MARKLSGIRWAACCAALLALAACAPRARAAELTAFVSSASPGESWKWGWGGGLSTTWFRVVNLEAEVWSQPEELDDGGLTAFTASALLAPRIGGLKPYGGIGLGLFRQTLGSRSDTGTLGAFILGVKAEVGLLIVKGEYRRIDLSGDPLIPLDQRFSVGAGISF